MLSVLILFMSSRTYSLKSIQYDKFLWKFFMAILFIKLREWFLLENCWEEVADIFFIFRFVGYVLHGVWTQASCLISQLHIAKRNLKHSYLRYLTIQYYSCIFCLHCLWYSSLPRNIFKFFPSLFIIIILHSLGPPQTISR